MLSLLSVLLLQSASGPGVADPAFARDGRLAASISGDLWVRTRDAPGQWIQITSGPAVDRQPAWSPDGTALIFSSDRAGNFDLWRVTVGPSGAGGPPQRLTESPEWEGDPAIGPGGTLVFVRGREPSGRLVRRSPTGDEQFVTPGRDGAERWPVIAPDGNRVAYVTLGVQGSALRVRWLASDSTTIVVSGRDAEHPAWSPDGARLVFSVRRGAAGVWVTPLDGSYVNLVSSVAAQAAWSPDGDSLALVELPPPEPPYNGDPDRLGAREFTDPAFSGRTLWFASAPQPPDRARIAVPLATGSRAALNAEAFDRVAQRTARLYFSDTSDSLRLRQWQAMQSAMRPRALAAQNAAELDAALHDLWDKHPPLRMPAVGRAGVSSAHPLATAAGLEILARGGNVVDAAVAVSFTLGVVEPDASGVGGYGQMLVQLTSLEAPALVEFMTRVPEDAGLARGELREQGGYPDDGPVLANVPGTVAGMYRAWQRYGSRLIPWHDLLAPAIRVAEEGFSVSDGLATTLRTEQAHFRKYQGSRALFFPQGEPLPAGAVLRNMDLARTLRAIADSGADAFYRGGIARRMAQDLHGQGNAIRAVDLARYYAADRDPVAGTYRGYTVYSSAPPSAGGATLIAQLNGLEHVARPRPYVNDGATLHAMVEAWKLVPSGRGRIADPGLWPVNTTAFVSKDSARARWRCFDPDRALTVPEVRGDPPPCAGGDGGVSSHGATREAHADPADCIGDPAATGHCHVAGTTAFVVGDAAGNVVAVTQTLGTWGGNFYVTPGLGFLYNDKLTSYGNDPADYGARLPGARHGSSLAPTIVFRGTGAQRRPILAVGAAGNAWITSAVYAMVSSVIDQGLDPQHAIELPRFLLSQRRGATGPARFAILLEAGIAPAAVADLGRLGDDPQVVSLLGELREGYAAAVALGDRYVVAAADPRRSGAAGAVGCGAGEARLCQVDGYPKVDRP